MSIAAVILAAGGSSRMGAPKQGLEFRGRPLVAHAAKVALDARLSPVFVVTGGDQGVVAGAVRGMGVQVVANQSWERGIGSSIRAGITAVAADPAIDGCVILLGDQPLVDHSLLIKLVAGFPIQNCIACRYAGTVGVPALFGRSWFASLLALRDDQGAKSLLRQEGDRVELIDFPEGEVDIDTPEDYRRATGAM